MAHTQDALDEQRAWQEREARYRVEHAGHEHAHDMMALILIAVLIGSQVAIVQWRRWHPSSFKSFSLAALWLFPVFVGMSAGFYRFLLVWAGFSLANAWIIRLATRSPLNHRTPAIVYKWFAYAYRITFGVGMFGYIALMLVLFGFADIFFSPETEAEFIVDCFGYGLYFGVLSKDLVDICSERMASTVGYYTSKDGLPSRALDSSTCAICGAMVEASFPLTNSGSGANVAEEEEELTDVRDMASARALDCGHVFHRACIRGWCLIGKRDMCPYCKEKVDLRAFSKNPWDTQQYFYLVLLGWVRYLVIWQPIVIVIVKLLYRVLDLK